MASGTGQAGTRTFRPPLHSLVLLHGLLIGILAGAESGFPPHGDAVLVLNAAAMPGNQGQEAKVVELRLQRGHGSWDPVVVGRTRQGQNATHYGYITAEQQEPDGTAVLTIRLFLRPDRWIGGAGDSSYRLRLRHEGGSCTGTWDGQMQGLAASGAVGGSWESQQPPTGYSPPESGEHPRLLLRRGDLERLRAQAATAEGRLTIATLRAEGGIVGLAFVHALTGDPTLAPAIRAALAGPCNPRSGWWHHTGGDQHDPAIRIVEHLIAYDLAHDLCTPEMHAGLRESIAGLLEVYYWGAYNSQFNPNDTSNWSLLYRSALGLMGLTILDAPATGAAQPAPSSPRSNLLRLTPPPAATWRDALPVNLWSAEQPHLRSWLFAGPVEEGCDADAFASHGGLAAQQPAAGQGPGPLVWRTLAAEELKASSHGLQVVGEDIDLARLSRRQPFTGCYFAGALEITEAGCYRLDALDMKGARIVHLLVNGHRWAPGDLVHLEAGRYPLAARVWTEPVGNWEPLVFSVALARSSDAETAAWVADRQAAAAADAFCGPDWRRRLEHATGRDLVALAYARMAIDKVERYLLAGIGDGGWDQEGGYTRHALHLAMPLALCYRNLFGREVRGAQRLGAYLTLATGRTILSDTAASAQTYFSGGGPLDLTLFARGYGFVPPAQRPTVLWTWNRCETLAAAGRYRDVHAISDSYDGLSQVMRFLFRTSDDREANPATVLPWTLVDRQKGGYVLRDRWQGGDDCVVQFFANSNQPGGTWSSSEGGIFRIDGLGTSWAVRGEGYAQGTARDRLDASPYENLVDVGEQFLPGPGQAQGQVVHETIPADGPAVIRLDLDAVYRHQPRLVVPDGRARPNKYLNEVLPRIKNDGEVVDLGIRAVRSLAVDYSGACGAPCLVVLADRLTGTRGRNTWTMVTPQAHRVEVVDDGFLIHADNGATLRATVVRPAGATIRLGAHAHVQEINYRGSHAHRRFDTTLIQVLGTDHDQEFLVVMTLQRGAAPEVGWGAGGLTATIGARSINFDGGVLRCD